MVVFFFNIGIPTFLAVKNYREELRTGSSSEMSSVFQKKIFFFLTRSRTFG